MPLQNAIDVPSNAISAKLSNIVFQSNPNVSGLAGASPSASLAAINIYTCGNGFTCEAYNNIAITTAGAVMSANGMNLDSAVAKNAGAIELTEGILSNSKSAYVAQTSAPFYVQATFYVATLASATQVIIGFRKAAAYAAALSSYTDFATIGIVGTSPAGEIQSQTQISSGGTVTTDSTQTATAATNFTVRVNVSAAGVVTYLFNGAAPTAVAAYTLAANTVVPFIQYRSAAGAHAEVSLVNYQCGLQ